MNKKQLGLRAIQWLREFPLKKSDKGYCAIGCLVARSLGQGLAIPYWPTVINTSVGKLNVDECRMDVSQEIDMSAYKGQAKAQIDATGFTVEELARIEEAFEGALWSPDDSIAVDHARNEAEWEIREICGMIPKEKIEMPEVINLNIV